jgi:ribosomal protein S18 acetylase RimI-like enzyme
MAVIVRRMAPDELDEVIDVWYRSLTGSLAYMRPEQQHSESDSKAFFRQVIAASRELWVALGETRVLGVMALEGNDLDRLYVAPEAQGRAVGSALLEHAKALHPNGLTLVTHQRNTGARRFYERHGFEAGALGVSPPPENEPDVRYAWRGSESTAMR